MTAISRSIRSLAFASAAALLLAAPLSAQEFTVATPPATPVPQVEPAPPAPVGPTVSAASVAVRRAPAELPVPAQAAPGGHGRGAALMIVGGAAVLTGIVVGNDAGYAISIAGAVIGLYGLYLYLQ